MAILAIGTDIVDIRRLQQATARHGDAFLARLFSAEERHYADSASHEQRRWLRYGNRYAAKEACFKALRLKGNGVGWQDISVTHHHDGAPSLLLSSYLNELIYQKLPAPMHEFQLLLSLSDEAPYSMAFVSLSAS